MALVTGFSPEQILSLGGAFCHPLRVSEEPNLRRQRLARKVATRIAKDTHFGWKHRNVFPVRSDQECMNDLRLVVRHAKVETFVKRKQVASRAGVREFHWCHQFAASDGTRRLQSLGVKRQEFVCVSVANGCSAVLRIGVSQVRIGGGNAMAVATFKLNVWTIRSATDRLHVNRVVQLDCARITRGDARDEAQRADFRMAVLETSNVRCEPRRAIPGLQVGVAFGASLIVGSGDVFAAAVFRVACSAPRSWRLGSVMYGAVMAVEASVVGSFHRIHAGLLHVTGGALFFENGVRFGQAAAAVNARVLENGAFGDPDQRE